MLMSIRTPQYLISGLQLKAAAAVATRYASTCSGFSKPTNHMPRVWTLVQQRKFQLHSSQANQANSQPSQQAKCSAMKQDAAHRKSKIFTLPNVLTSTRILLTPAIGYLIWHEMHFYALSCFALAAFTDLMDGFIARHMNQCSEIGAILDPIADKVLLTTCFLSLYHVDLMPVWLVGSFIIRDILLLGGGALLRYRSFCEKPYLKQYINFNKYPAPNFEPTYLSKCNTALQCSLIVTHLGTQHLAGSSHYYDLLITGLHALTATTTIASFGQYSTRACGTTGYKLPTRENQDSGLQN